MFYKATGVGERRIIRRVVKAPWRRSRVARKVHTKRSSRRRTSPRLGVRKGALGGVLCRSYALHSTRAARTSLPGNAVPQSHSHVISIWMSASHHIHIYFFRRHPRVRPRFFRRNKSPDRKARTREQSASLHLSEVENLLEMREFIAANF